MRRHAFGIIAILFLAGAAVAFWQSGISGAQGSMVTSICLRVGLVLGGVWLAYAQVQQLAERVPPWLIACIGLSLVIVLIRPKAIVVLLPILGAIIVLQFIGWLVKPLSRDPSASPPSRTEPRQSRSVAKTSKQR